jgi:hypothetical protein
MPKNKRNTKSNRSDGVAADELLGEALKKYKALLMVEDGRAGDEEIDRLMQQTAQLRQAYKKPSRLLVFSRPRTWLAMAAAITLLLGAVGVWRTGRGDTGLVIVDVLSQDDMRFAMRGDNGIITSSQILSNLQAVASHQVGTPVATVTDDVIAGEGSVRYKLVVSYAEGEDNRVDLVLLEVSTGKEFGRTSVPVDASPDELQGALSKILLNVQKGKK